MQENTELHNKTKNQRPRILSYFLRLTYIDTLLASDLSQQIIKVDDFVLNLNATNPTGQKCITAG